VLIVEKILRLVQIDMLTIKHQNLIGKSSLGIFFLHYLKFNQSKMCLLIFLSLLLTRLPTRFSKVLDDPADPRITFMWAFLKKCSRVYLVKNR
jgi:hypothetical protein